MLRGDLGIGFAGTVGFSTWPNARRFMNCQCGCGESVPNGSFKPGHDQRLTADLERRVGGIMALRDLVEAAESYGTGLTGKEDLTMAVTLHRNTPERG